MNVLSSDDFKKNYIFCYELISDLFQIEWQCVFYYREKMNFRPFGFPSQMKQQHNNQFLLLR